MQVGDLDLPPSDTVRWSPYRKASVVNGVRNGTITIEEACRRYQLSAEEFLAWQGAIETYGVGALRVTRFQCYRDAPPRR
jgi:transposase-like protein